eukprot:6977-Eustigmatos_ZCMA.PRE.1
MALTALGCMEHRGACSADQVRPEWSLSSHHVSMRGRCCPPRYLGNRRLICFVLGCYRTLAMVQ